MKASSWTIGIVAALLCTACAGSDAAAPLVPPREVAVGETLKLRSGLEFTQLRAGFGERPTASDSVRVHYHGTLQDGAVFDSSIERGQASTFPLDGVIACWTEGIQLMKAGSKARLVCPARIAYGSRGRPPKIPENATLTFEVELLEIL